MNCSFEKVESGIFRCSQCGTERYEPRYRQCDGQASPLPKRPGPVALAANLVAATAEHAAAGFPQASPEDVAARFAVCQACELFKPADDSSGICCHSSCGCNLKAVGVTGLNKLAWAEQACPIGKWQAVSPFQGA